MSHACVVTEELLALLGAAGVKASPLLGMSMSQFVGIQIFSRNVYVCNDRKIFKALARSGFAKLAEETYAQQVGPLDSEAEDVDYRLQR